MQSKKTKSDIPMRLGQMLQKSYVEEKQLPSVFLAVQTAGAEPIVVARGVRDLKSMEPVAPDDHVRVGSITKTFTAMAILKLAQEGKLRLDDSIEKWLPGVMSNFQPREIRIRYLLNHTSGIPDIWGVAPALVGVANPAGCEAGNPSFYKGCNFYNAYCTDPATRVDATLLVAGVNTQGPRHSPAPAPPVAWSYSNTNYDLLGMVIEKVTGMKWEAYLNEAFIRPLGLTRTSIPERGKGDTSIPAPYARGYISPRVSCPLRSDSTELADYSVLAPDAAWAAGAMISTVGDIARWMRAIASGKILNEEYQALYEKSDMVDAALCKERPLARYGLGITLDEIKGFRGHRGQILGYDCSMQYQEEHDTVYVACATKTFPGVCCQDTTYPPRVMEDTNPVVTDAAAILYPAP